MTRRFHSNFNSNMAEIKIRDLVITKFGNFRKQFLVGPTNFRNINDNNGVSNNEFKLVVRNVTSVLSTSAEGSRSGNKSVYEFSPISTVDPLTLKFE